MHDANGTPLQKGDRVLIPCVITQLSPCETFCNVDVRTELGRRPDGQVNTFSAINTAQLIKFRSAEPEPAEVGDVYFDRSTGLRPEDIEVNLDLPEFTTA